MKKYAYSFPILKDKVNLWLDFVNEINTTRNKDFSEMHNRIGVTKESWYLQETEKGYDVIIYTEAEDEHFMKNFKNDNSEFSAWFREKVSACQGINLNTKITMPDIVLDWSE